MKSRSLFLALAAVSVGLTSFGAIRATTPQIPDMPWTKSWWMPRHLAHCATVTNGGAKVVFIGDSITHFWEEVLRGRRPMQKYLGAGDRKMLNLGMSGDRTEHVLWRLTEGGELDGYEAKCILLMIGTNNSGHFPFEKEPPADTILGIRRILEVIAEKQPKATVVLTAIFPCGAGPTDVNRLRNAAVNKEIARFADGRRVFWCDFGEQFLTPEGLLSRDIFPDLLHPNERGYEIWYAAVKPYIDYALSDGKLPAPANRYASCVRRESFRTAEAKTVYPDSRIRIETYGKFDWWLNRLEQKRNQIADSNGAFDLVFLGDSITHNWDPDDPAMSGGRRPGADVFDELRKTYAILDIGYSGDETQNVVWRAENGELDGYRAKCIMLMIGTNNRHDGAEDVAKGIRRILDVIARKQPQAKTLLLPIFPCGADAKDKYRVKNEAVNAIIRDYADGEKVIWVDFNAKFLDEKGDTHWIMPDRLHPNAKGYREIWLPAVLPHFQRIVGK